jgi:excisionase family DNA binding protein
MSIQALPAPELYVTPEPYLTRKQLAPLMAISVRTLDRMIAEGMPCVRWGRRTLRLRASSALEWAHEQDRKSD